MFRRLLLIGAMMLTGCTTAPQADVMDFVFPARDACVQPNMTAGATAMQPQQAGRNGCSSCKDKLEDCALCRPFRIFRRNR